jgi:hypothetical protein
MVFVKVHVPFEKLLQAAEEVGLYMKLRREADKAADDNETIAELKRIVRHEKAPEPHYDAHGNAVPPQQKGCSPGAWLSGLLWPSTEVNESMLAYSARFRVAHCQKFHGFKAGDESFFTLAQRAELTMHWLNHTAYEPGDGTTNSYIGLDRLLRRGVYKTAFPLHGDGYDFYGRPLFPPPQTAARRLSNTFLISHDSAHHDTATDGASRRAWSPARAGPDAPAASAAYVGVGESDLNNDSRVSMREYLKKHWASYRKWRHQQVRSLNFLAGFLRRRFQLAGVINTWYSYVQPLDMIRSYFGEKFTFYYAW